MLEKHQKINGKGYAVDVVKTKNGYKVLLTAEDQSRTADGVGNTERAAFEAAKKALEEQE